MIKRLLHTVLFLLLLVPCSCDPDRMNPFSGPGPEECYPEGTPVTLVLPFGYSEMNDIRVGTKAESPAVDESRIHDLYVMIFDKGDADDPEDPKRANPQKIYGQYFSYERLKTQAELDASKNECWFVNNKTLASADNPVLQTTGAVKISTVSCSNAILVVIANIANAITNLDGQNGLERLNEVSDYNTLKSIEVGLEQDVVNRKDLFLMTAWADPFSTSNIHYSTTQIQLRPITAKVKFRVKVNTDSIASVRPVYWQVCNTPSSCYLNENQTNEQGKKYPSDVRYFESQQTYFEGTEYDKHTEIVNGVPTEVIDNTYYTFCFYTLENRQDPLNLATDYYQRELQYKHEPDNAPDWEVDPSKKVVTNGDWEYAPQNSTYVKFDMVITLKPQGLLGYQGVDPNISINHALTSDAIYTVHLGDFTSSETDNSGRINNYYVERGNCYTYTITINNTSSIFAEVKTDEETQPGVEGFLLLTDDEIVNADAHYEYHQLNFKYRANLLNGPFSWYVKTPFGEGGPDRVLLENGKYDYLADGERYQIGTEAGIPVYKNAPKLDYRWVKFGVNSLRENGDEAEVNNGVSIPAGSYTAKRHAYPGDDYYDEAWEPGKTVRETDAKGNAIRCSDQQRNRPDLMDITQLVKYILSETAKESASQGSSDFKAESDYRIIRVTAFIDEYYYERHPLTGQVDKDLWREFVNAQPREMHILSEAVGSRDQKSDVILSSHSIIQQSIQTIYNIYAPDLRTLWGTEHMDENRKNDPNGWPYWPGDNETNKYYNDANVARRGADNALGRENGRLNSAYIWSVYDSQGAGGTESQPNWSDYLDYNVMNDTPELLPSKQGMAFSCMNRNRDNNGNGKIDRNEVRWYLAAINQIAGMWIGNEALSINARLYQPATGQWRAHIVSSTDLRVSWAEEGGGATPYSWDFENGRYTWGTMAQASKGESVRCLRNIGTFEDNSGEMKDISEAPYDQEIQKYFTLTDNGDWSYTFYFDRLSTKSMREITEGELPYHDQFNVANCVYLKMITQSRNDDVENFSSEGETIKTINNTVTKEGYNRFCPPGYRFPNQSEMLLMTLYLDRPFFYDKNGNAPAGRFPTRTYYDRGLYGSKASDPQSSGTEGNKVGWSMWTTDYRQHCAAQTDLQSRSRCVKDENMTGYIEGAIDLGSDKLFPDETRTVDFKFTSSASALTFAELKLCYTKHNGSFVEKDIALDKSPKGLQYQLRQGIRIPTLEELGLEGADLATSKREMKLTMRLRNAAGTDTTIEKPFVLASHYGGRIEVLPDFDPINGFKIRIDAESVSEYFPIKTVKLRWRQGNGAYTEQEVTVADPTQASGTYYCYWHPTWLDNPNENVVSDNAVTQKYYFSAIVGGDSDSGIAGLNDNLVDAEMEFLKINYNPNPGNWTYANQPPASTKWYAQTIDNMQFNSGDFIDAYMDVSNCTYDPKNPNGPVTKQDLGMDNLLSIGPSLQTNKDTPARSDCLEWGQGNGNIILYYPARNGVNNNLQIAVLTSKISRVQPFAIASGKLKVLIKRDNVNNRGCLLLNNYDPASPDDVEPNWETQEINTYQSGMAEAAQGKLNDLTSRSTVYIASTEGNHRSRALYKYVRVVRKHPY